MNKRRAGCATALAVAVAAAQAQSSGADLTTADIASETLGAAATCSRYEVVGACFFLKCVLFKCSVKTSLRVRHFTPDLVVSLYHDPHSHPWEYGRMVAQQTERAGASISGVPLVDSGGTRHKQKRAAGASVMFRDADAIGNPANLLSMLLSGSSPSFDNPSSMPIPTPFELMAFLQQGPQQILTQWQSIPQSFYSNGQAQSAQQQFDASSILGSASGQLSRVTGALGSFGGSLNFGQSGGGSQGDGGSGSGPGNDGGSGAGQGNGQGDNGQSSDGGSFVCPPGATPFGLYFLSHLDAMSWRGLWQLEQLYPATWLPGMREIGSGLSQTWGNLFPRQGSLVEQNPVKGSAVLAQRVADIVGQGAQPHIYAPLQLQPGGYVWFGFQGVRENDPNHTTWQRLYPNPERACVAFGANDSASLTSYGDGQNVSDRGVVFNMWRRQECCKRLTPIFLGSFATQ